MTGSLTEAGKSAVRATLSSGRGMLLSLLFASYKIIQDVTGEYSEKNIYIWDFGEQACCGPSSQAGIQLKDVH